MNNPFVELLRGNRVERISRAQRSHLGNYSRFPGSDPTATLGAPEPSGKRWRQVLLLMSAGFRGNFWKPGAGAGPEVYLLTPHPPHVHRGGCHPLQNNRIHHNPIGISDNTPNSSLNLPIALTAFLPQSLGRWHLFIPLTKATV